MSSRPPSVLEAILRSTREELERRKLLLSPQALEAQLPSFQASRGDRRGRSLASALGTPGIAVISEFKRRSPSAGSLRASADVGEIVLAYERGGAAALSVLTEGPNFGGSLEDLRLARAACELPILRKDFIVDPYQLHESLLAGADAVLLIVAALEQAQLATLHRAAGELGLDVLVEVHDQRELAQRVEPGCEVDRHQQPRSARLQRRRRAHRGADRRGAAGCVRRLGVGDPTQRAASRAGGRGCQRGAGGRVTDARERPRGGAPSADARRRRRAPSRGYTLRENLGTPLVRFIQPSSPLLIIA